jgi:hypothetical protein
LTSLFFTQRRVWRYQRGNQNSYIEEEHNGQKKKVQKDKQRSTKHTHNIKDRVTRTPLKTANIELICSTLFHEKEWHCRQKHSSTDPRGSLTLISLIDMLQFLIAKIFYMFGWHVFQQAIGIHIYIKCTPLFAWISFICTYMTHTLYRWYPDSMVYDYVNRMRLTLAHVYS